jgi:hypothetical protein
VSIKKKFPLLRFFILFYNPQLKAREGTRNIKITFLNDQNKFYWKIQKINKGFYENFNVDIKHSLIRRCCYFQGDQIWQFSPVGLNLETHWDLFWKNKVAQLNGYVLGYFCVIFFYIFTKISSFKTCFVLGILRFQKWFDAGVWIF